MFTLILVTSGSYGSFVNILLSSFVSGMVGWIIWMLIGMINMPRHSQLRLKHMLSGGCFTLLLFNNVNHPFLNILFQTLSQGTGLPITQINGPVMFMFGVILGFIIYIFNSENEYKRQPDA
ncbi:hypothetical protein QX776_02200 [Alteromonadaceae bacterium BrNp21-10]|nr:hypothetical protein [Alteromonadaceae bacterium BrNp21-10]